MNKENLIRKAPYFIIAVSFAFVFGYLIFFLIVPFILYNQLNSWDLAGLYFSAWYQKGYLFPHIIGWNPFFFLGYAQNQFYPPLFSYLTTALSYLMPLSIAFKIIFSVTLILMPVSFYAFNRAFKFSKAKSAAGMILMFALLFLFPEEIYGGNMHATFRVGLITHALGIALFFFYWASLHKSVESRKYMIPSILFVLIILIHIVAAFAASFLFLTYFIIKARKKEDIKFFILHGTLTFLLSAFWVVPFIGKINWLEAYKIGLSPQIILFILIAFLYFTFLYFSKQKEYYSIGLFMLILIAFSFLSAFYESIPIHLYRFMMYLYILLPFIILSLFRKERVIIYVFIIVLSIIIVLDSTPVAPEGPEFLRTNSLNLSELKDGRVFVMASYSKESSPHYLQHSIPMQNNIYSLRGLYIESAKNARYIFDVENELEPGDSVAWGTYIDSNFINENSISGILPYQLNLFAVHDIISPTNFGYNWSKGNIITSYTKEYPHGNINYTYNLYYFGNSSLIEVLDYKPETFEGDEKEWKLKSAEWFLGDGIKKGVIVRANARELPDYTSRGNEKVDIFDMSKRQDYIKFKVESKYDVPILIKISNFPNWKAYEISKDAKKELKIYTASPYIMLIYGKGEIELKYENLFIDYFGGILSLFGVFWLTLRLFKKS